MENRGSLPADWIAEGWQDTGTQLIGPPIPEDELPPDSGPQPFVVKDEFYHWLKAHIDHWDKKNAPLQNCQQDGPNRLTQTFRFGQLRRVKVKDKFQIFLGNLGADLLKFIERFTASQQTLQGAENHITFLQDQVAGLEGYASGLEEQVQQLQIQLQNCLNGNPSTSSTQSVIISPGAKVSLTPPQRLQWALIGAIIGAAIAVAITLLGAHLGKASPSGIIGMSSAGGSTSSSVPAHFCAAANAGYQMMCPINWTASPLEGQDIRHGLLIASQDHQDIFIVLPLVQTLQPSEYSTFFANYLTGFTGTVPAIASQAQQTSAGKNTWEAFDASFQMNAQTYQGRLYGMNRQGATVLVLTMAPKNRFAAVQAGFQTMLQSFTLTS